MGADLIVGYLEYAPGMSDGDPYETLSELRARICGLPDDVLLRVAEHRWPCEELDGDKEMCDRARDALHGALGVFYEDRRDVSTWRDRIVAGGTSWGEGFESLDDIEMLDVSGICEEPMPWHTAPVYHEADPPLSANHTNAIAMVLANTWEPGDNVDTDALVREVIEAHYGRVLPDTARELTLRARLGEIIVGLDCAIAESCDVDDLLATPDFRIAETPFLSVESGNDGLWLSLHATVADAAEANYQQEYASDWNLDTIIDVRDGSRWGATPTWTAYPATDNTVTIPPTTEAP